MALPTIANLAATNDGAYLLFTGDRDTSWRTTLKPSLGLDDTMRLRIEWQVSNTGSFSGEESSYITPSVSDARSWTRYPEGTNPLGVGFEQDPPESLYLADIAAGETIYARCRVIQYDDSSNVVDTGSWSSTASATRSASGEPSWIDQSIPSESPPDLDDCLLMFGVLVGGSYDGVNAEDQLGVGLPASESYWGAIRTTIDELLVKAGTSSANCGFCARSAFGTNKVFKTATTSEEWYALQGGRNIDLSTFDVTGGGTSPAMMNPLQSYAHSSALPTGTTKTKMLSLLDLSPISDLTVPFALYISLIGAAHIHSPYSDIRRILNAHGLLYPTNNNLHLCMDVFFNASPYDPETTLKSPELKIAEALDSLSIPWFGERLSKTANASWLPYITSGGDIGSWAVAVDDSAYASAKVSGTRIDLRTLSKDTQTDFADLPNKSLLLITTNVCSWVAAGSTNIIKCQRALEVAKDVLYTWGGQVIPVILNQSQWDEMPTSDLAEYMVYAASRVGKEPPTSSSLISIPGGHVRNPKLNWIHA